MKLCWFRRDQNNDLACTWQLDTSEYAAVAPITLKIVGICFQVAKWVMRALDMGVDALRAEYRSLARYTLQDATYEAFKANHEAGRNR